MEISFLVVGTPRSGTTLVQRLCCELSDVSMSPETHFFSSGFALDLVRRGRFPLRGGALDDELAIYLSSYEAFAGDELPLDTTRVKGLLGDVCEGPTSLFASIVRSLAAPDPIVGEKTPDHIRWWRPISRSMPNVKFVFVVRDPRAVVESTLRMDWGGSSHLKLAERWRRDQLETIAASRVLGERRCFIVRYEDVVEDPGTFRESLAAFLGADGPLDGVAPRTEAPVPIVLPWEPWKQGALGPVTTGHVDAWRKTLPSDQSLDVAAICHSQMRRFGYRSPGGSVWSRRRLARLAPELRKRRRAFRRSSTKKQWLIDAARF